MMEMNHSNWKKTGFVATIIIVLSIPLSLFMNRNNEVIKTSGAVFTGGKACIECHQKEYGLWKESDHDNAMDIASDVSVLGNFNDKQFTFKGITSKFYKRDGMFFVFTEGVGGKMQEFQITHTFGVRPLQQYLIPFENGKYQCLPIAWNTEKKEWFHMAAMVYSPDDLKPDNWLYWTNQSQNWNSMCAECHSTDLQKNFNPETKSYTTSWVDINVNCEACHGPGSAHIEWANIPEMGRPMDVNTGLIVKTSKVTSRQYVESCAPCHARRSSLGPYNHEHSEFLSYAIPQLATEPSYHIDGQFREEDYEYGSFTQSKMYLKDVRCGDCHDPHSLKRKFEGNALCTQCHREDEYDTFNHHMHKSAGESGNSFVNKRGETIGVGAGALCRDCHMPGKYYMGIDKRFDHSMRIPRPDLSIQLGTPNACTNCHDDKTDSWALEYVNKWYGAAKKAHFATILADASQGNAGADAGLLKIINSNLYPEIIRATAIEYLSVYRSETAQETLRKTLNDPDPLLRYAVVENYLTSDSAELMRLIAPLLNDPIKSVRMQAANRLSTYRKSAFNDIQYRLFVTAIEEYRKSLEYVADFSTGRYNLGNYYSKRKDLAKAEENYAESIAIDALFYPSKINLGLIYYQQGKVREAELVFNDLVINHPEITEGYYYLALLYGEQNRNNEAIALLESARMKNVANARILYNLGLLYQRIGRFDKSEEILDEGLRLEPLNFDLLYALFAFNVQQNNRSRASKYIEQLKSAYPDNQQVIDLYNNFMQNR